MTRSQLFVRLASALVILGLVIELASLFWLHPLAFILFAIVGGAALGAGLLLYLYWLLIGRPGEALPQPRIKE